MPELFRRSGYHTVLIGKLSHTADGRVFAYDGSGDGRDELPNAWDELATPLGAWGRGWGVFFAYEGGAHREDGEGHRDLMQFTAEDDDDLPDGLMAAVAVEQLEALRDRGEPFFLGLGFFKPHLPFVATRGDWEAVQQWDIPPPTHAPRAASAYWHNSGEFYGYNVPWNKSRPLDEDAALQARRAYLACVRYTDRQVGRVLDALDELGLADNTIVVLWGDHGWFLGEGALWGKHAPLETALRSPLILRVPDLGGRSRFLGGGRSTDTLVTTTDLYPTLIDLCQTTFSETHYPLDGLSLAPVLTRRPAPHCAGMW
ncbi:sulfatase-like hydrolase/transferase [Phycisphaeraceae bacterium D3-23]